MWGSGLKWMFLIMGTMIGAGYASGRELWQFFGEESGLAILLFTIIFSISCYVVMLISYEQKSEHFQPVLKVLVGKRWSIVYDLLILFYLFTTTVVMIAGGGATLQTFQIPFSMGISLFSALVALIFIKGIKGMIQVNSIVIPVLIIGLIAVLLMFMLKNGNPWALTWTSQANWPAGFTFTALNILPLVAVMAAIGRDIKSKKEIVVASVGSGLLLGAISFIYNESLMQVANELPLYEIPLFAILKYFPYIMLVIMTILLLIAIYTTAVSGVLGIVTRISNQNRIPIWLTSCFILILMIPFTYIGFANLISILYPIYGLLNLYLLTAILLYPFMNRYK
ncbi:YkvI family membrane protein [Priestia abyssalis]|uniref:YkvI family membrane protein n=1 Tax=Priestia abyssalis TaxID=1221450 RepID=UPI000994F69D|nr:hypothetical protein [Priestia abyssalis]